LSAAFALGGKCHVLQLMLLVKMKWCKNDDGDKSDNIINGQLHKISV